MKRSDDWSIQKVQLERKCMMGYTSKMYLIVFSPSCQILSNNCIWMSWDAIILFYHLNSKEILVTMLIGNECLGAQLYENDQKRLFLLFYVFVLQIISFEILKQFFTLKDKAFFLLSGVTLSYWFKGLWYYIWLNSEIFRHWKLILYFQALWRL